jgi:short chain dehydrogenase
MSKKEMTMQDKPVALVTGANQGIGLQIAKDLVAHGFTVLVGSRNLERGEAAAKEVGPDARAIQLDVTDDPNTDSPDHRRGCCLGFPRVTRQTPIQIMDRSRAVQLSFLYKTASFR